MIDTLENDIQVAPPKKILRKNFQFRKPGYSLFRDNKIKKMPGKKYLSEQHWHFHFIKWKMPPQPQGYIKGWANDCL